MLGCDIRCFHGLGSELSIPNLPLVDEVVREGEPLNLVEAVHELAGVLLGLQLPTDNHLLGLLGIILEALVHLYSGVLIDLNSKGVLLAELVPESDGMLLEPADHLLLAEVLPNLILPLEIEQLLTK